MTLLERASARRWLCAILLAVAFASGTTSSALSAQITITQNAAIDTFITATKFPHSNQGINPVVAVGAHPRGVARGVIGFNLPEGIPLDSLTEARLVMDLARPVGCVVGSAPSTLVVPLPISVPVVEGNAHLEGLSLDKPVRGSGPGVTWNCPIDTNIANLKSDCSQSWQGGKTGTGAATAAGASLSQGQTGEVSWTVTQDVAAAIAAGATSVNWLLQGEKPAAFNLRFHAKEGPHPELAARLVLTFNTPDIQLQANVTSFLAGQPTTVRFQAQVSPSPALDPNSVTLKRTSDDAQLCQLRDNGDLGNGDDIAGDSVFSCFASFNEGTPTEIGVAAAAKIGASTVTSPVLILHVVEPLTQAQAQLVVNGQQDAQQLWVQKLAELGDTLAAREAAVALIKTLPGVQDAGVSADNTTIWIMYESGVHGGLMLNPPGTKGSSKAPASVRASQAQPIDPAFVGLPASFPILYPQTLAKQAASALKAITPLAEPVEVGSNSVLVWDPYNDQFPTEGAAYAKIFRDAACPKFNVVHVTGTSASVNSVNSFTSYGTVALSTHGAVDGDGQVNFLTREGSNVFSILAHAIDLILGRVGIMGDVFTIRPSYVTALPGAFPDAIIHNSSCQSAANSTMANAFTSKGARTYHGFTQVVSGSFAEQAGTQLLKGLVEELKTTGDAFAAVNPKVDPNTNPPAIFTQSGDKKVIYSGALKNGDFEKGSLAGWVANGDGRAIASLGQFSPTDGQFMGIISTGLGFTTSSGSVEQAFCLPKTAKSITFDWNYNSEELREWCGAQHPYDDPFAVELTTDAGTQTLYTENVDSVCGSVSPTSLYFDQSGPGCEPSEGVGVGTGGNDCTVWSTGWRSKTIDVSAIAAANKGKGVTLRFRNYDTGDSIFDTATLLDRIRVLDK